jgi:hypothetical protein
MSYTAKQTLAKLDETEYVSAATVLKILHSLPNWQVAEETKGPKAKQKCFVPSRHNTTMGVRILRGAFVGSRKKEGHTADSRLLDPYLEPVAPKPPSQPRAGASPPKKGKKPAKPISYNQNANGDKLVFEIRSYPFPAQSELVDKVIARCRDTAKPPALLVRWDDEVDEIPTGFFAAKDDPATALRKENERLRREVEELRKGKADVGSSSGSSSSQEVRRATITRKRKQAPTGTVETVDTPADGAATVTAKPGPTPTAEAVDNGVADPPPKKKRTTKRVGKRKGKQLADDDDRYQDHEVQDSDAEENDGAGGAQGAEGEGTPAKKTPGKHDEREDDKDDDDEEEDEEGEDDEDEEDDEEEDADDSQEEIAKMLSQAANDLLGPKGKRPGAKPTPATTARPSRTPKNLDGVKNLSDLVDKEIEELDQIGTGTGKAAGGGKKNGKDGKPEQEGGSKRRTGK